MAARCSGRRGCSVKIMRLERLGGRGGRIRTAFAEAVAPVSARDVASSLVSAGPDTVACTARSETVRPVGVLALLLVDARPRALAGPRTTSDACRKGAAANGAAANGATRGSKGMSRWHPHREGRLIPRVCRIPAGGLCKLELWATEGVCGRAVRMATRSNVVEWIIVRKAVDAHHTRIYCAPYYWTKVPVVSRAASVSEGL